VAGDYGYREDVPGVGGDYICGDEVDLGAGVGGAVGVEVAFVGAAALEQGAFHLDAEEVSAAFDGEVVGGVVAPGLGDAQAEFGGAGHETELRPLAARLGVADGTFWILHGFRPCFYRFWAIKTRPWRAAWLLLLSYIQYSNLGGGNRTFGGDYIVRGCLEIGVEGVVMPLDKNSAVFGI